MQTFAGTSGNDYLVGTSGDDSIIGLAGNDTIVGGGGWDTLSGGDGGDLIKVGSGYFPLVFGDAGDDTLIANSVGYEASLDGGPGNDRIDGVIQAPGSPHGYASYGSATSGVQVTLAIQGGPQTVGGGAGVDTLVNVNGLQGSAFGDTLTAGAVGAIIRGGDGNDLIQGGQGDDSLVGQGGDDTLIGGDAVNVQLQGGDGNDSIVGGAGGDGIVGGFGDDTIIGGAGVDYIYPGAGDDVVNGGPGGSNFVVYENGFDTVTGPMTIDLNVHGPQAVGGGMGVDTLVNIQSVKVDTIGFNDTVSGTDEANTLLVSGWDDSVSGLGGDDFLTAGAGRSTLNGGAGNDTIMCGSQHDQLDGGSGLDVVFLSFKALVDLSQGTARFSSVSGPAFDPINQLVGFEAVVASGDNDTLVGSAGADDLEGRGGADSIDGGAGDDSISGGDGDDVLDGGSGHNVLFVQGFYSLQDFSSGAQAPTGESVDLAAGTATAGFSDHDTIANFQDVVGGTGADTLAGDGQNNRLDGGTGNDLLMGRAGDDTLDGGAGSDGVIYVGSRSAFAIHTAKVGGVFVTTAQDTTGAEGTDTVQNVETFAFAGSNFGFAGIQQNHQQNLDGGRFDDVLFQRTSTGTVYYQAMNGNAVPGGFQNVLGALPAGWKAVGSADINGDGRADTIIQDTTTGSLYDVDQSGGGSAWNVITTGITSAWKFMGAGDVNGDGNVDVVIRDSATGTVLYRDIAHSSWGSVLGAGTGWNTVGVGDFNRDGYSDVAIQNTTDGTVYYANMAGGSFTGWGLITGALDTAWRVVGTGDINGDGYSDVVFQNSSTGQVWWDDMLGGSNHGWGVVANGLSGWTVRDVADLNNDGYADVVVQNNTDGTTYFADMHGGAFHGWGVVSGAVGTDWVVV